ncbi:hypothetical protein GCM10017322_31690 [Paracoccus aerius]|nr:hypothetical protein GCM10017322_31690 [Paracoccus aerius]
MFWPKSLGFLTMSALSAATVMTSNLLGVVADAGGDMDYDWMRYVVTRYEPGDGPQNQMVSFMRSMFGDHVLNHPVLKSQFTRATYERALESLNAVNGEIEGLIQAAWGRKGG